MNSAPGTSRWISGAMVSAQEHGLDHAARMQQPVGEDMAALGIGAELDLVDRQAIRPAVQRHRFDGADEIARIGRHDLLLAGDQRDGARAPFSATMRS
jgi:hypothetical protein